MNNICRFLMVASLTMSAGCIFAESLGMLTPSDSQGWKFAHSPEMGFQSEFTSEGLRLALQGVPGSANWSSSSVDVDWITPAKGAVAITLRAEEQKATYFAVQLVGSDGKKYDAVVSGNPSRGYLITTEDATAEVPLSMFVDAEGHPISEGTSISRVAVIFSIEPNFANSISIAKIDLTSK